MEENNQASLPLSELRESLRIPLSELEPSDGENLRVENRAAAREQAGLLRQKRRSEKAEAPRGRAGKTAAAQPAPAQARGAEAGVPAQKENGAFVLPLSVQEKADVPKSRFQILFGSDLFFAVSTICCGGVSVLWTILYWFVLGERSASFNQAAVTMAQQGRTDYTVIFSHPLLSFLRVLLGVLAALAVMWAVAAVLADRKRSDTGKKAVLFTVLGLLLLVGTLTLYDLGAAGLVFDVLKQ